MAKKFDFSKTYNKDDVFQTLNDINIYQQGDYIITKFQNRPISETKVTNKYQIFDFSSFSKSIIEQVENYFTPETYKLRVRQGVQELRLIGEEIYINGERYHKMLNILNSTDKTRALQLNIGLMRFICTNGLVAAVEDEYTGFKNKHFKSSLPQAVENFMKNIEKFNIIVDKQSTIIESLSKKIISFQEIAKNLALNKDGVVKESNLLKLKAFSKKLMTSKTDRLDTSLLNQEQLHLLTFPEIFNSTNVDIEIPAYQAFNNYTELYREYDSSVMKRETNRILQLI
jgi:hypothetical protein